MITTCVVAKYEYDLVEGKPWYMFCWLFIRRRIDGTHGIHLGYFMNDEKYSVRGKSVA